MTKNLRYAMYRQNWFDTHEYGEPACYQEWLDNEYAEYVEDGYLEYEKIMMNMLTLELKGKGTRFLKSHFEIIIAYVIGYWKQQYKSFDLRLWAHWIAIQCIYEDDRFGFFSTLNNIALRNFPEYESQQWQNLAEAYNEYRV